MRKFTVALLALAFVAGFAISASAADVKLSGQYYVKGIFSDNHALTNNPGGTTQGTQLIHQRLRVQPEVAIADGLKLVMRFDALEKKWGDTTGGSSAVPTDPKYDSSDRIIVADTSLQENIEFERVYVDFNTGIGKFMVGYQNFAAWGTAFGDTHATRPGVKYFLPLGDVILFGAIEKAYENKAVMDGDAEYYDLAVIKKLANGEAGILWQYARIAQYRVLLFDPPDDVANLRTINAFLPYYKGTFLDGDVYFEAEGLYAKGKVAFEDIPAGFPFPIPDINMKGYGLYAHAKANLAPFYVGAMGVYMSGDDLTTTDLEGSLAADLGFGKAFAPTLMMWNDEYLTIAGNYASADATVAMTPYIDNCKFFYLYAGWKPTANSDLKVAFATASANENAVENQVGKAYGREMDVVFTYNVYANLQYQVGAGYFWVGDFFKGADASAKVGNDYLIYHKLILNF